MWACFTEPRRLTWIKLKSSRLPGSTTATPPSVCGAPCPGDAAARSGRTGPDTRCALSRRQPRGSCRGSVGDPDFSFSCCAPAGTRSLVAKAGQTFDLHRQRYQVRIVSSSSSNTFATASQALPLSSGAPTRVGQHGARPKPRGIRPSPCAVHYGGKGRVSAYQVTDFDVPFDEFASAMPSPTSGGLITCSAMSRRHGLEQRAAHAAGWKCVPLLRMQLQRVPAGEETGASRWIKASCTSADSSSARTSGQRRFARSRSGRLAHRCLDRVQDDGSRCEDR